jgi:hypothetical protein
MMMQRCPYGGALDVFEVAWKVVRPLHQRHVQPTRSISIISQAPSAINIVRYDSDSGT